MSKNHFFELLPERKLQVIYQSAHSSDLTDLLTYRTNVYNSGKFSAFQTSLKLGFLVHNRSTLSF